MYKSKAVLILSYVIMLGGLAAAVFTWIKTDHIDQTLLYIVLSSVGSIIYGFNKKKED